MRRLFLPILLLASARAYAQTGATGQISGVVLSDGGQPLVSAQVVVRNAADSSAVRGTVSGSEGRFLIERMPTGTYNLRVTFVGYKPHNILNVVITNQQPHVELGTMKLAIAPIELTQLEATVAKSPVVIEADRTIHDTRDLIAGKGGKAVDVLRAIPELEVDVNGKVTMRGNQTVTIQFNGRTAPMKGDALTNYLQQMPGDRIAKVEVVPNPGAKYDPEGAGGIVNIVLKDNVDLGLSGNLSLNGSTRLSRGGGLRVNYQKGRLAVFTGGNINFTRSASTMYDLRRNLLATPVTLFQQDGTVKQTGRFDFGDFNSELRVGKQATMWLNGSTYGSRNDQDRLTGYQILANDMALLESYDRTLGSRNLYRGAQVSSGFKQVFVPNKHELSIELYRDLGGNSYTNDIRKLLSDANAPVALTHTDADGDNRENVFTMDYTRPTRRGKLEAGARLSARLTSLDIATNLRADEDVDVSTSSTLNNYDYREHFRSAYVTLNRPVNKLSLTGGLRAELATTDFELPVTGDNFHNHYPTLFPSAAALYDFGGGTTVRINYGKRIGRPSPDVLNPYYIVLDPLNLQAGNPHLRPNYTHSMSADLNRTAKFGTLRLSTYYRHTVDQWTNIKRVDLLGVSTVTWENLSDMQTYG
ncbi:MAG TPA: outer membrane beta-barrel protein, partial [Longimicrobiales bacterium]|nr:outer membrane beta-barrel protein [Longimicrobiales bacterium]